MREGAIGVSRDQILGSYFGRETEEPAVRAAKTTISDRDLTPAAKYVVREAKKRLGQESVFGEGGLPDEQALYRLVSHVELTEGEQLTEKERTAVVAALNASREHYDILTPLVENPDVNDIIVKSYKDVSIQTGRANLQTDVSFADHESYKAFVENLLKRAGKSCTTATPVVDAAIDPHVRACVTHESFSPPGAGPMLTLRIARHHNISLDALVQYELAPRMVLDYLARVVRDGKATVLIAGEVGTGKTTLIKALAMKTVPSEAILVIEDTHEIVLERPFVRSLLTREANTEGAGRISPAQAIRTGMRMAMNRVILGEMRDAEAAEAFIDVCASGHAGMSTIHARSGRDAISRLELFLARAQGHVTIETIRKQISNAVSVVVFIDIDKSTRMRRIFEVVEVGSAADGAVQISPIFSYAPRDNIPEWKRDGGVSSYQELLATSEMNLPQSGERLSLDPESLYRSHTERHYSQ